MSKPIYKNAEGVRIIVDNGPYLKEDADKKAKAYSKSTGVKFEAYLYNGKGPSAWYIREALLHQGEYLTLTETDKGDLRLTLTPSGKAILDDLYDLIDPDTGDRSDFPELNTERRWLHTHSHILADLLEDIRCNSSLELLSESDYSAFGMLTSSPVIAEWIDRDDDGEVSGAGKVYWFPQYEIESELDALLDQGEVIFTFAKQPESFGEAITPEKSKGDLLEAIAILAEAGVINSSIEENLQDRVETLFQA